MKPNRRRGPPPSKIVRIYGRHAVEAALANPERMILRLHATPEVIAAFHMPKGIVVQQGGVMDLARLVPPDAPHQGMVLEVEPLDGPHIEDLLREGTGPLVVLDQVTDPHNVGAILRSCAAFGAVGLVTQDRHSPPETGVVARAASGALERVPWARVVNLARALEIIGEAGFWRVGLDGSAKLPIDRALGNGRVCLVLGAEGEGMRQNTVAHCDELARLPITDAVESLNVSNAAAVALYAATRRG